MNKQKIMPLALTLGLVIFSMSTAIATGLAMAHAFDINPIATYHMALIMAWIVTIVAILIAVIYKFNIAKTNR
ncbi:MAG: hypothetical protein QXS81_04980 [Candidatus Micrarchaeaceae archaeon]